MHPAFQVLADSLHPKFEALLKAQAFSYPSLPTRLPERGIYLFSEAESHLYVGRSNRLRRRVQHHCRPGGTHLSATFAFRIARADANYTVASYKTEGSRAKLCADPAFAQTFGVAKARVANMQIRCVEETDPVVQALLEIYVATVLRTPFNDFDNH
jgi:hypothetical protein